MNPLNQLLEYMKIHLISLKQDRENKDYKFTGDQCLELNGQIWATEHLLSVAEGMIKE